ncbi:hypothetical protein AB6A40_006786 [Gnathostoma spinigerum]|uniref:Ribosomal protein L1 n=1 Tax=Gnathostoma spinigerum TaxID=75299 RepID=A0ABD6EU49_9BILA
MTEHDKKEKNVHTEGRMKRQVGGIILPETMSSSSPKVRVKRLKLHESVDLLGCKSGIKSGIKEKDVVGNVKESGGESIGHIDEDKPSLTNSDGDKKNRTKVDLVNLETDGGLIAQSTYISGLRKKVTEAIEALKQLTDGNKQKLLFPEVDFRLGVLFVYKKPALAQSTMLKKRIILPHPLYDENVTVCIFLGDRDRSKAARKDPDVDKQSNEWSEILEREHEITKKQVQKIITVNQMEREYRTYYDKRQLAHAYDIFLVDKKVEAVMRTHCGKEFLKARKDPIRVELKRPLLPQIEKARSTVLLPLKAFKPNVSLMVGNLSQPSAAVIDNVESAIMQVLDVCPGGLANIRSINLYSSKPGPTIPVYLDAGSANDIKLRSPQKSKNHPYKQETIDELSTLPEGLMVAVRRDGNIKVLDATSKKEVLFPTVNDEFEENDDLKPTIDPRKVNRKRGKNRRRRLAIKKGKLKKVDKKETAVLSSGIAKMVELSKTVITEELKNEVKLRTLRKKESEGVRKASVKVKRKVNASNGGKSMESLKAKSSGSKLRRPRKLKEKKGGKIKKTSMKAE